MTFIPAAISKKATADFAVQAGTFLAQSLAGVGAN